MRELKFRSYTDGKMKYSDEYNSLEAFFAFHQPDCSSHPNDIIMQFTGLKDKNGTEIYEGDEVCIEEKYSEPFGSIKFVPKTKVVSFEDGYYNIIISRFGNDLQYEVVGNIYKN